MSFRDWIELESDPGLFTLLVYDFGVQNVEVEEVYDLSKPFERSVYGFIFLFKWTEERKSRRKAVVVEENFVFDEDIETDMFFAQQIIPNSCASHALLSVLLNVQEINLGFTLKQLRDSCKGFDSETKGHAIGNFWNIAVAHNNHGRPELRWHNSNLKNVTASRSMEAFHYVSYIPCKGRLFELDGLKPHPIDHGPWLPDESWSDKARRVIQDRIQLATGGEYSHDIRYNLLAVVPEQRQSFKQKMDILNHNKKVLIELFKKLANKESFLSTSKSSSLFKPNFFDHPFVRKRSKKAKFERGPQSPNNSSASSTVSVSESQHQLSDSEDSSVETYRIKSIMRGRLNCPVYVYGEGDDQGDNTEGNSGETNGDNVNNDNYRKRKELDDDRLERSPNEKTAASEDVCKKIKLDVNVPEETNCDVTRISLHDASRQNQSDVSNSQQPTDELQSPLKITLPSMTNRQLTASFVKELTNSVIVREDLKCNILVDSSTKNDKSAQETAAVECDNDIACENEAVLKHDETMRNEEKVECNENKQEEAEKERDGLGVEIIADDADITCLLDQHKLEKLSLDFLVKYEDQIKLPDLQKCMQELDEMYKACESSYKEELEKIENYKIDDCRRRHNYDPFVSTFLSMLADQGQLTKLLEQQNTVIKRVSSTWGKVSNGGKKENSKKKGMKKKNGKKK